ncbi:MAG: BamA/TamA family outer membrane protein [Lewinellaceae bacterium]|nr:BamA/TamA family outer membrane protein [Lewinellaceae bacterium]
MVVRWIRIACTFFLFTFGFYVANAQGVKCFDISTYTHPNSLRHWKYISVDSSVFSRTIDSIVADFHKEGYFGSKVDTVKCHDTCQVIIFKGEKIRAMHLLLSDEDNAMLENAGVHWEKAPLKFLDKNERQIVFDHVCQYYGNIGYPFYKIQMDDVTFQKDTCFARLIMDKGPRVKIDSIVITGDIRLKKSFFYRYLSISRGSFYNHGLIEDIPDKLNNLPFVNLEKPPSLWFDDGSATLSLYVNKKPASRFDFLLGVIPQQNVTDGKKYVFTIDFVGELYNAFGYGEYSYLQIKRLKPSQFNLNLKSDIPYLGSLPVGSYLEFKILNSGVENFDVSFELGGQWVFGRGNTLRLLYKQFSSSLISIDTIQLKKNMRLPDRLDLQQTSGGMQFLYKKLDYIYNPTKGYAFDIKAMIGKKKFKQNIDILKIEGYENAYDTLRASSIFSEISVQGAYYHTLNTWSSIKTALHAQINYNPEKVSLNEFFRVGGNASIRGFEEQSILTDRYTYFSAEFHINFDKNSFLSLPFIDVGWAHVQGENNTFYTDRIIGVGLGLNFGTKAGLFNVSFAAGQRIGLPIDFSKMKVHFGYVNLF